MFLLRYSHLIVLNLTLLGVILLHVLAIGSSSVEAMRDKNQLNDDSKIGQSENVEIKLSECSYDKGDFKKIITSASKAMDFFEVHLKDLVIDAAIGTRIMEAQLALALAGHPRLPSALKMYLMTLQSKSKILSDQIMNAFLVQLLRGNMSAEKKKSINDQLPWITNATLWETPNVGGWKSFSILEAFQQTLNITVIGKRDEVLGETMSDNCIGKLFHSCSITEQCSRLFMQKPHSLYSLTHQVIFFLIADKYGCFAHEEFRSKTLDEDPAKFLETLCGKVWVEANSVEASGYPSHFIDLLAEQVTVCSTAGYPNFLKRVWLEKLLSWQSTDESLGCFVDINNDEESVSTMDWERSLMPEEESLNFENIQDKLEKLRRWDDEYGNQRVKRSDEIVKIGREKCSVHFTAVCLGSLAMHTRYFTDTCLSSY